MKNMNYRTGSGTAQPVKAKELKKRTSSRLFTSTVEYTMIANLVLQQYQKGANIQFDALLAIHMEDRIPGLIKKYGYKTMHQLLMMVLTEFIATLPIPVYKRPTETRVSVAACEIMLSAEEDFLSLEDVILFLQRAKGGFYGPMKSLVTTQVIIKMLDEYRQHRHQAYQELKTENEARLKTLGPVVRIAKEPTSINDLFQTGLVVDMTQKMSG